MAAHQARVLPGARAVPAHGGSALRSLILQHDHNAPAGLLGDWLAERGELVTARLDLAERPPDPRGFDLVVTLGSEKAADDDDVPWQAVERDALREAIAADVPVFGVCFGAQSLASALGGGVRRAARPELGWVTVGTRAPELVPDGPWLAWHDDELLPPPRADVLAANASGVQAYRVGPHAAIQFHPEVTPAIVVAWDGSPELVAETERQFPAARERAARLFAAMIPAARGSLYGHESP